MQCGCPECGILMIHARRNHEGACVCSRCSCTCDICLGTNSVLSADALRQMENLIAPPGADGPGSGGKKAFDRALRYIAVKPRTEQEVRKRLAGQGFADFAVEEAVEKLKGYRYIDDEAYAAQFLSENSTRLSSRMAKIKLRRQGISADTIAAAALQAQTGEDYSAALALGKKMLRTLSGDRMNTRRKLTQRLSYRGFDYDTIRRVCAVLLEDCEDLSDD